MESKTKTKKERERESIVMVAIEERNLNYLLPKANLAISDISLL